MAYNGYSDRALNNHTYIVSQSPDDEPDDAEISHTSSHICMMAQTDDMHTFLRGVHPDYYHYINNGISCEFGELTDNVVEKLTEGKSQFTQKQIKIIHDCVEQAATEKTKILQGNLSDYSGRKFIRPIMNMLEFLTPAEMAQMAEMLVNMVVFRKHITHCEENVGGPIDVAVITQTDGLLWYKRKNIFGSCNN